MPEYLYTFGYETPRQRQNNAAHGWDDEDSQCVLIAAPDAETARAWGDRIAHTYVSLLYASPEFNWAAEDYASAIELAAGQFDCLRVQTGEYPDFAPWLEKDRM